MFMSSSSMTLPSISRAFDGACDAPLPAYSPIPKRPIRTSHDLAELFERHVEDELLSSPEFLRREPRHVARPEAASSPICEAAFRLRLAHQSPLARPGA